MSTDPFTVGIASVPIPNSYWVRPGQLLAGEYPGSMSLADANQRIQMLLHAGVNSFVDLTEEGEMPAYDRCCPSSANSTFVTGAWPCSITACPTRRRIWCGSWI